ncbi:MAG: ComF family protein [Candidatus Omnitrophica bacterium]|nr:ComF family protein [Candidatus Omnitrophota bacterium]
MVNMLKTMIDSFIDIIYPPLCATCNKPNHQKENKGYICDECFYGIKRHIPPFCSKCGRSLNDMENISRGICASCMDKQYYFDRAHSLCVYKGDIKELIHRFKYNQKLQYKIIFEKLIREFLQNFNILRDIDLIIPIPLHPARLREREYNQSQIIASIAGGLLEKPVEADILFRIRNTKPQIELNEKTRIKNISGCFTVRNTDKIKSKSVLLIDDVLTTGTTLSEAAQVIKKYNPDKISVLTLAS